MSFTVKNKIRLTGQFADINGDPIDPTTVTVRVKTPSGVETSYVYLTDVSVVRDSIGAYHMDILVNEVGNWLYCFDGDGNVTGHREKGFNVEASEFVTP